MVMQFCWKRFIQACGCGVLQRVARDRSASGGSRAWVAAWTPQTAEAVRNNFVVGKIRRRALSYNRSPHTVFWWFFLPLFLSVNRGCSRRNTEVFNFDADCDASVCRAPNAHNGSPASYGNQPVVEPRFKRQLEQTFDLCSFSPCRAWMRREQETAAAGVLRFTGK